MDVKLKVKFEKKKNKKYFGISKGIQLELLRSQPDEYLERETLNQ